MSQVLSLNDRIIVNLAKILSDKIGCKE